MGPPLPAGDVKLIYDVHDIGNPFLWWFSTVAILLLLWALAQRWVFSSASQRFSALNIGSGWSPAQTWIALYVIINWCANLLPWEMITRCTFIYHYLESSVFAELALAWLIEQWLHSHWSGLRALSVTVIFLILLAFVFWVPIYLGLPLSPEALSHRMWLRSWI